MKVYDPYSNIFYDNSEKLQTVASDRTYKMRDATLEERTYVYNYIKSISKPTGITFFEEESTDADSN